MSVGQRVVQVLLPLPTDQTFDFLVPEELEGAIAVGKRVRVRFQKSPRWGIVTALSGETEHPAPLEPVLEVALAPAFSEKALLFCRDIACYYFAPLGPVVNRTLPRTVSRKTEQYFTLAKDLEEVLPHLEALSKRAPRQAAVLRFLLASAGPCSGEDLQRHVALASRALHRLIAQGWVQVLVPSYFAARKARAESPGWVNRWVNRLPQTGQILLFAQRRWEAYRRLLETPFAGSKSALVVAPEILLATELYSYLREELGCAIDLYHSGLPEGERGRVWERARNGESRLVVGTRSALFLPFTNLDLVVLDEEQDWTYKQDEMLPYYHARTVARKRIGDGLLIFGSCAPSLETFSAARAGGLTLARPKEAKEKHPVYVVNMSGEKGVLSQPLLEAINRTLAAGKRVLIGVNRRGYFQGVLCKGCNRPLRCPRCRLNLTYLAEQAQLVCQLCGRVHEPMRCPHCGSRALRFLGVGSERVEQEVKQQFPQAQVFRIDTDTYQIQLRKEVLAEELIASADIVVATPMLAKGPTLSRLGLVAAVGLDALVAAPNFRAAERTYQYLTGLIGRLEAGEAIFQTHYPDHYAVRAAASADYDGFFEQEIAERKTLFYPPFSHLARLLLTRRSVANRRKDTEKLEGILRNFEVEVLGPAPQPSRRGGETLLIKGSDVETVRAACTAALEAVANLKIDVDPYWI